MRISGLLTVVLVTAALLPPAQEGSVVWVWSGGVTPDSAVVKARVVPGTREVRLLVDDEPAIASPLASPPSGFAEPDEDGVVAFELSGLEPGTRYHYVVEAAGDRYLPGEFRTFPDGPASFRLVAGSCATTGSSHRIFDTIRELDPLLMIHMGDLHYEDIDVPRPALFREAFDAVLTSERQSALYRHTPIAYMWDDHDYGPDDADRTSPARAAAQAVYRQVVPHYPLFSVSGEVFTFQQAFSVGRVRFLITDMRSERTPKPAPDGPGKTMLGIPQRNWLLREIERARDTHALVVWVSTVPWITKSEPGSLDGWEPYTWERAYIADRIRELDMVDRMIMISGDAHMLAADDGTNSNYATDAPPDEPGFPVFHAAPLDRYPRVKGGPYSHGTVAETRFFGIGKRRQFGLFDFTDDGEVLTVQFTGRDHDGEIFEGMHLRVRCEADGCRPVESSIEAIRR